MDYSYINQLLDSYWNCETSLEEEQILRTFFSQKDIPAELERYRSLFVYQAEEVKTDVLGAEFDERILALTETPTKVKARVVTMRQRLMPLFKAAAVVAIVLSLSNAIQMSFDSQEPQMGNANGYDYLKEHHGTAVAKADSAVIDTLQQSSLHTEETPSYIK